MEAGEDLLEAAVRETVEETGLRIRVLGILGLYCKPYADDLVIGVYAEVIKQDRVWQPNDEIAELKWVSKNDFPAPMSFNTKVRIQDAFGQRNGVIRVFDTPESLRDANE